MIAYGPTGGRHLWGLLCYLRRRDVVGALIIGAPGISVSKTSEVHYGKLPPPRHIRRPWLKWRSVCRPGIPRLVFLNRSQETLIPSAILSEPPPHFATSISFSPHRCTTCGVSNHIMPKGMMRRGGGCRLRL